MKMSLLYRIRLALARPERAVLLYSALAFAFSWSYWLTLLARGERVGPGSTASHLPGLFGPFLAALVVTALADGAPGLRQFLQSCFRLPAPRWRSCLLAVSPLMVGAVIWAVLAAWGDAGQPTTIVTRSGKPLVVRQRTDGTAGPSLSGEGRIVYEGILREL